MVAIKKTFYFLVVCVVLVILSQAQTMGNFTDSHEASAPDYSTQKVDTKDADVENLAWLK